MVSITVLFDVLAVAGFGGGTVLAVMNYRDFELEAGFWSNVAFGTLLGAMWTGVVALEWLGVSGSFWDLLSLILLSITVGVFAITSTGSLSSITDLKAERRNVEQERRKAHAARDEAQQLNDTLESKAAAFGRTMSAAADGDLTQRMDPESRSEAMEQIATSFNAMMADLESTMKSIRTFSGEVVDETETVSNSTREVESASQQVSESVQEIAATSSRQSASLETVSDEMNDLSATVEEVASSADEVATTAEEAADRGDAGRANANDAIDAMAEIETTSERTVEEIESLESEMAAIGEIVDMIDDIAEQTNMLALNASIEAARAGEAGEGFAVVAGEIKDLAMEVGEATRKIEARIEDVAKSTTGTVDEIQEMRAEVTTGAETIEESVQALEDITGYVESINDSIQEVSRATDEQAASAQEVVAMVDEVVGDSQQTVDETENVSAAAEEQTASLTEVSSSVDVLANRASDLETHIATFEIEDGVDAADARRVDAGNAAGTRAAADGGADTFGEFDSS